MTPPAVASRAAAPALRVLITDADTRPGLAATRSIGRQGHFVVVAGHRDPSLASVSRFCSQFALYPDPARDPKAFTARVVDLARELGIDVIIPITEITTLLLTENRHLLPERCRLPFPSAAAVATAADKSKVLALADTLGVPTPKMVVLERADELQAAAPQLGYPVVIKPARSRVPSEKGFVSTGVTYADDYPELTAKVNSLPAEVFPVLLQERVEGEGVGVFACFQDGAPIATFAHRRIREKPPSGGVSVLCESTPVDPEAARHAVSLLSALEWQGVAMVEFKRHRDGALRLMEINGRFWGSLQLAIDAGVDFPAMAVAIAQGRKLEPLAGYRNGVRSRWLWGDFDSLLMVLRKRRSDHLPAGHPGRVRSLISFLNVFDGRTRYDTLQWGDMRPWLLESKRWFLRQ